MGDFSNLFVRKFDKSERKLFYEMAVKATTFEWSVKLFMSVLPSFLYLKSIVEKTKQEHIELRKKNGKFKDLNELIKLMFDHFHFLQGEKSYIEQARCCRNKLFHYNLMELLEKLDTNKEFYFILLRRYKSNETMKNKPLILSELNALHTLITHKRFVNKLNTIFEQAIDPIEEKLITVNSEISRLGKIAHEKNLLP